MSSPALSIRQPWAWLILNAGKDVENRNWKTSFRGHVWLHASKGMTRFEYENAATDAPVKARGIELPNIDQLERGGIVGSARIVDCVARSASPWFCGDYGFVLADVKPCVFTPCLGVLGFFRLPVEIEQSLIGGAA